MELQERIRGGSRAGSDGAGGRGARIGTSDVIGAAPWSEAGRIAREGPRANAGLGEELFNCFGPMNDRTIASFGVLEEMMDYSANEAVPEKLKPGSWAQGSTTRWRALKCPRRCVRP